jgi:hypothetical protein
LTEEQKLQAKQNYLISLADKAMFIKTMKQWHTDAYGNEDDEERSPSYGEMADADKLVSDDVMRQEGVEYVPDDFEREGPKPMEKKGIETTVVRGIPQWAVDYFVNAETSALDDEDLKLVKGYEKKLLEQGLRLIAPIAGTEDVFNPYPEFGLACDTVDFEAEVLEKKDKEAS